MPGIADQAAVDQAATEKEEQVKKDVSNNINVYGPNINIDKKVIISDGDSGESSKTGMYFSIGIGVFVLILILILIIVGAIVFLKKKKSKEPSTLILKPQGKPHAQSGPRPSAQTGILQAAQSISPGQPIQAAPVAS
jgi:hypothetical protein